MCFLCVFFFKQRSAVDLRISDWSSDVCSSDLRLCPFAVWLRQSPRWRRGFPGSLGLGGRLALQLATALGLSHHATRQGDRNQQGGALEERLDPEGAGPEGELQPLHAEGQREVGAQGAPPVGAAGERRGAEKAPRHPGGA